MQLESRAQEADLMDREVAAIEQHLLQKLREIITDAISGRLAQHQLDHRMADIKRDLEWLRGKHAPAPFDYLRVRPPVS